MNETNETIFDQLILSQNSQYHKPKYRLYHSNVNILNRNMTRAVANAHFRMPKLIVSSNATQGIQM